MLKEEQLASFKATLNKIEQITIHLASNEFSLEQNLNELKQSVQLVRQDQKIMHQAECMVQILLNNTLDAMFAFYTGNDAL